MTPAALAQLRGVRIAQLIESDGPGGAERMVAQLAAALLAAGAEVVAFLPADGEGWLADQLADTGVRIEPFRLGGPLSRRSAHRLAEALRRHRVAIAHSHEFAMAVYGAWAARRAGIPHLITMHGGRYYARRLRRRAALRIAAMLSTRLVAVADHVAARLAGDLLLRRSRIATVPNGVPAVPATGSRVRGELGLAANDRLVLAVGNLYPVKGHALLLEAAALLAEQLPTLHVAVAGRGPLEQPLAAHARRLGVARRVHLLGLRPDVPDLLAAADLFALPSLSEGLPLALLEAMHARVPIVASDVGEVRTALADGGAGILVPPGDPAALAAAIRRVFTEPETAQQLATTATQRARAEYDVCRAAERYAALYCAALRTP